jgi:exo-beta-1,3-glucanase (GH17 family)
MRALWFSLFLVTACSSSSPGTGITESEDEINSPAGSGSPGDGDGSPSGDGDGTSAGAGGGSSQGDGQPAGAGDGAPGAGNGVPSGAGDGEPVGGDEDGNGRRRLSMSGRAISFSPYRAGQSPDREGWDPSARPSSAQLLEDLRILSRHWQNIRMYAAGPVTADTVRLIDEHDLPLEVMVGVWLAPEPNEAARQFNEQEAERAITIAREHPGVVGAISVANEVLVDWSTHKVDLERVIYFVRKVREATSVPVTTADNYVWWRQHGARLAQEVDFLVIHTYPFWERHDIDLSNPSDRRAIDYTVANYQGVAAAHPGLQIVIGEAGWATADNGNPQIIPYAGSEPKQKVYYQQLMAWSEAEGILTFTFSAFDEKWKGGPDPSEPEKNWGLFFENRTPKQVMRELFGDLTPTQL